MKKAFTDHGVVAKADQDRAAAIVRSVDGTLYLAICAKGYVLSVNLHAHKVLPADGQIRFSSSGIWYCPAKRHGADPAGHRNPAFASEEGWLFDGIYRKASYENRRPIEYTTEGKSGLQLL